STVRTERSSAGRSPSSGSGGSHEHRADGAELRRAQPPRAGAEGAMSIDVGTSNLRLTRDGPVAWCVIDRPAARNALTPAMYYGIKRAVHLVNTDPDLGALIITGVDDVFAPGGDLGGRSEPGESWPDAAGSDVLPFLAIRDR